MSATVERFGRRPRLRTASVLVLLMFCVTAWWAEASGEESRGWGDDDPEDSDVPAVSVLPEPSPGLGLIPSVDGASSSGAAHRLLRPPRS